MTVFQAISNFQRNIGLEKKKQKLINSKLPGHLSLFDQTNVSAAMKNKKASNSQNSTAHPVLCLIITLVPCALCFVFDYYVSTLRTLSCV